MIDCMKKYLNEILKYKKYILNAGLTLVTYLGILIYFKIIFSNASFNFLLLLLFFFIFGFYNKFGFCYKNEDRRTKIVSTVFAIVLSFILIVGSLVSSHVAEPTGLIFNFHTIIYAIVGIFGFYFPIKILSCIGLKKLPCITINSKRQMSKKLFFLIFVLLLLCWLPYFLRYFPAVMTPDSYYSVHFVENKMLNDFHAFGHTWFFGGFYYLGKLIFNDGNMAVGFFIIIQMIICSILFTYLIKFLYDKGIRKVYLVIIGLFIAFSPLYAIYSVTLWRDILFGMAFITLFISLYNFVYNDYEFKVSNVLIYLLSILVILFFRNNGIYVFLLFIPFLVIFTQKRRIIVAGFNLAIVIVYFVIKGPIFSYFGDRKSVV